MITSGDNSLTELKNNKLFTVAPTFTHCIFSKTTYRDALSD